MLVAGIGACSSDSASAPTSTTTHRTTTTSTAPERPTSTTTTTYAPESVEGQVEAAYLKSWDVYAEAVYDLHLDEAALAEVFTGEHLETKRSEIQARIDEGRASWVRVEHSYTIQLVDDETAIVIDRYRNHQVLIDPETKVATEEDPDVEVVVAVTVRLAGGRWQVSRIEGLE